MRISKVSITWTISLLVAVPLVIFLVNTLIFSSNSKDVSIEAANYIENSRDIELTIPEQIQFGARMKYEGVKLIGNRAKVKGTTVADFFFYCKEYNRHFRIVLVGNKKFMVDQLMIFSRVLAEKPIIARINNYEWEDRYYGTSENPVPIFMFSIPRYKGWNDYEEIAVTEEQYRNSVYYYLSGFSDEELKE